MPSGTTKPIIPSERGRKKHRATKFRPKNFQSGKAWNEEFMSRFIMLKTGILVSF
jgi:hypothetical protein